MFLILFIIINLNHILMINLKMMLHNLLFIYPIYLIYLIYLIYFIDLFWSMTNHEPWNFKMQPTSKIKMKITWVFSDFNVNLDVINSFETIYGSALYLLHFSLILKNGWFAFPLFYIIIYHFGFILLF